MSKEYKHVSVITMALSFASHHLHSTFLLHVLNTACISLSAVPDIPRAQFYGTTTANTNISS